MPSVRESEDGTPLSAAEAGRRVAALASGGLAATCVVLLAAMLSLDPNKLDIRLHQALVFLAIALPLLMQSAVLAFVKVAKAVAYTLLVAGTLCLVSALSLTFAHLDQTASNVFNLVIVLSAGLVTQLFLREMGKRAQRRRAATARLRKAQQEATETQAGAQAGDAM